MLTQEQLRDLLARRKHQVNAALKLIEARPHHAKRLNVTLQLACKEVGDAVGYFDDINPLDEEVVKATLMEPYLRFLRCLAPITADHFEEDTRRERDARSKSG